ncbi:MAG TPA: hypothetical protein VFR56_05555 [Actinomycetes bacterium]|nr:hypothetical protein [Actinomycetes bacterium]
MPSTAGDPTAYCDQCGEPEATGDHQTCTRRRRLEPPRWCRSCRRRMVVQVTPRGWSARCSVHGTTTSEQPAVPS